MKRLLPFLLVAVLAACGVETAGTAATSAEIKKRELEAGRSTYDQAKQKIELNTQQIQQSAEKSGDAEK